MRPQYNPTVKVWGWFAVSALWLALLAASRFEFNVAVRSGRYLPHWLALPLVAALFYLVLFGWVIPLCVGLWRLRLRLTHRL